MSNYKIRFHATERDNPPDLERRSSIAALLLQRSFGDYEVMCLDIDKYEFVPFDEALLLEELKQRINFSIVLSSGVTDEDIEGSLSITWTSDKNTHNFVISIDHDDFVNSGEVGRFQNFVRGIAGLFTKLSEGVTRAIEFDDENYYGKHGLEHLDGCFSGYVAWIHILGAEHYGVYGYSKEDLLGAPAFRVQEWSDGTIFLMSYEDPFSWNERPTIEQIKKLNNYLLETADDVQW